MTGRSAKAAARGLVVRLFPADRRRGQALRRLAVRTGVIPDRRPWHPRLLAALAESRPAARFVQVGSNDASWGDPLRAHIVDGQWRGLMIEALPHIFERLRERYRMVDGLDFANVAIDTSPGKRPFYFVHGSARDDLPPWFDQLGSFLKENVLKHDSQIPDLAGRMVETTVRCDTFANVCADHGIEKFDVLHIDVEGYDYELLKDIDLTAFTPSIVLFEHKHLSEQDYAAARSGLRDAEYLTHGDQDDCVGVSVEALREIPEIATAWRNLRASARLDPELQHSGR